MQALHTEPNSNPSAYQQLKIINGILYHAGKPYVSKDSALKPLFCRNSTRHHWEDMREFQKLLDISNKMFFGMACVRILLTSPQLVLHVNTLSTYLDLRLDVSNQNPSYDDLGRRCNGLHHEITQFSACKAVELFTYIICKCHGYPRSIITNRDPVFLSQQTLFRLNGTKLQMSTAYLSQTDGQADVLNRCLQPYLHVFVHKKPTDWPNIYIGSIGVTTPLHSSTGLSPFQVVYGRPPPTISTYIPTNMKAMDTTLTNSDSILHEQQSQLLKA